MTIINPKSITGVTSITTPSGSDNLFTVHTNNTTERIRINNDGDVIVGSGITVSPDGDIFATGVCTATSFVGSGANLTGVASTENIRTNTNATFLQNINVSGSTTTGSLVSSGAISGTTGTFTGDVDIADKIVHTGDTNTAIRFPAADTVTTETGGSERVRIYANGAVLIGADSGEAGGDAKLAIDCQGLDIYDGVGDASNYGLIFANDPTGDKANGIGFFNDSASTCGGYIVHQDKGGGNIGDLVFGTSASSDTPVERLRISSAGDLKFNSGFGSVTTVYGCRAWIQLSQSGSQSITGSGGVSSITDEGTGITTITFTTAMPDDNFAMVGGAQQSSVTSLNYQFSLCMQSYTTTTALLIYRPSATSDTKEDNSKIHVAFFR